MGDGNSMMIAGRFAALLPDRDGLSAALRDIAEGGRAWRSWWVLAGNDVRQRYRRSAIGQFWVTLSMGLTILGMGIVYSAIFRQPAENYIPFLATGMIVWSFFQATINDLAAAFSHSEVYLRSYPGPRTVPLFRCLVRNLIHMAHNLVLLPIVWVLYGAPLDSTILLAVPGALLCIATIGAGSLLLAPLCTRFRDLSQIVQNAMQLLFFVTPVMFRPQQLGDQLSFLLHFNPLANMLEIMRAPLLGEVPEMHHYLMVLIYLAAGLAVALPFYARFRGRIVYWL
jgi:lipopolysaccharide transport system permease protein